MIAGVDLQMIVRNGGVLPAHLIGKIEKNIARAGAEFGEMEISLLVGGVAAMFGCDMQTRRGLAGVGESDFAGNLGGLREANRAAVGCRGCKKINLMLPIDMSDAIIQ